MTRLPTHDPAPVFDREAFHRRHPSTLDVVDTVAIELGLELAQEAPAPAPAEPEQPVAAPPAKDSPATIRRELWQRTTSEERLAAATGQSIDVAEKPTPEKAAKSEPPASREDSILPDTQPEPEVTEAPAAPFGAILKDDDPEPVDTEDEEDDADLPDAQDEDDEVGKEAGVFSVILAFILLVIFVGIDCHYNLFTPPPYMLAARLLAFAVGLCYTISTAWRAAGKKLLAAIVIALLFLFHFNNNAPVLSIVESLVEEYGVPVKGDRGAGDEETATPVPPATPDDGAL